MSGDGFSVARGVLAPLGYTFGTGVPTITPAVLAGVDIFVIGPLGAPLSLEETCILETFVNQGGAVLDSRNMGSPSIFGVEQVNFGGIGAANIINASDPDVAQIVAGVSSPVGVGANSELTPDGGIPFLQDSNRPIGLVFPPTSGRLGRAVIIGDEEIFMNSFGGCPGSPHGLNSNNQTLLVNTFAYLCGAPGLDPNADFASCVFTSPPPPPCASANVSPGEFAGFTLVYDLAIPNNMGTGPTGTPPYTTDNSGSITPGSFDRIAYFLKLDDGSGPQFIWVSVDTFTTDPTKIGVPTLTSGAVFQQTVGNMNVESNVFGIVTGTGITTGNIEFWPFNYGTAAVLGGIGGNGSLYDFNDQSANGADYGSMQIHNHVAGQTLLAYNDWGGNPTLPIDDVGIGNNTSSNTFDGKVHPDWTFQQNAATYTTKLLEVYVRAATNQPPVADAGPDQTNANAVECTSPSGASVSLDGSGSFDPDNDPLTYTWREGTTVLAGPTTTTSIPIEIVSLSLGNHTIDLEVSDGSATDTDQVLVNVVDTADPVPDVATLADVTGQCSATISGPPTATDICTGAITGTTTDALTRTTQGTSVVT